MLIYTASDKKYVEMCRDLGWDNDTIQKYLSYRSKRSLAVRRGRTAFKDSNQSRVYEAESQYHHNMGYGKRFKTIDECEKYVNRIIKSKLWAELCGGDAKVVTIGAMNSRRWAGMAYGSHITLSNSGYNQYVILHELAHCCGNMHHDISFRRDLLRLVSRFLGRENAQCLKHAFKTHGLKLSMKSSVKEPLEWFASYNKMAEMRLRRKLPSASTDNV